MRALTVSAPPLCGPPVVGPTLAYKALLCYRVSLSPGRKTRLVIASTSGWLITRADGTSTAARELIATFLGGGATSGGEFFP